MIIWFDLLMMVVLFFMGLCFYRSNGKGANLLSGYNMKTKEERSRFDEPQMCRIYGRKMMQMAIPFFFGAVIDLIGMDRVCGTVCAAAAFAGENGKINGITKAQKFFCAFVMLIPLSHTPFPRCNKPPPYIPPFLLPLSEVLSISPAKSHMFRL